MKFYKYHGCGNDYIILDPEDGWNIPEVEQIKLICHRNFGVGSDGILFGPIRNQSTFAVRIFNPDGSEAEKSGNGLRIFSRYLFDKGLVGNTEFSIYTAGGFVRSQILLNGESVKIQMGQVSFDGYKIPLKGITGEILNKTINIKGVSYTFSAATIGNPHCVIIMDKIGEAIAKELGPLIENHELFPNRTNVQFVKIIDRSNISIEIWERGAGYTMASGSSSSAAASVCKRLNLCDSPITVHMPGGKLEIVISDHFDIIMAGPVVSICKGEISETLFNR